MKKHTEADLAKKVIAYLEDLKWDIYQEVNFQWGGKTADIIAVQGPILWVIECKLSASLTVIEQALEWRRHAVNQVSIAVPSSGRMARTICRRFGIGIIYAKRGPYNDVHEGERPSILRKSSAELRSQLKPEHKTYAEAGNPNGRRWTPFQSTCREVPESCAKQTRHSF